MRTWLILCLYTLCAWGIQAANPIDTIPLHSKHGLLFIDVQIDGQTHPFILDTGMPISLVGSHLLTESDAPADSLQTVDTGGRIRKLPRSRFGRLQIGGQTMPPLSVLSTSLKGSLWECLGAEGFIGNDVWQGRKLTIDVKQGYATVSESGKLPKSFRKYRVPMQIGKDGMLYIDVQVGKLTMPQALFDSGDTGLFNPNAYSFQQLRTRFNPDVWEGKITDATTGSHAIALHGVVPADSLWRVEFPQWGLGNTSFKGVSSVAGGQSPVSSVGSPLAKYGRIIIDYGAACFYFIPYEEKPQVSLLPDWNFQPAGGHIVVSLVWPRSQAYAQGLRPGMRVVSVNGKPLNNDICLLLSLQEDGEIQSMQTIDAAGTLRTFTGLGGGRSRANSSKD